MLLMQRLQAIIHFKAGSLEDEAKKGRTPETQGRGKGTSQGYAELYRASLQSLRGCLLLRHQKPTLWPWPASQEQMVARP